MKFPQNLVSVSQIILDGSCTGLVIKHVKHLPKVHWACTIGPSITDQKKHDLISVILLLDILIHPYLPYNVNGLHTEPLANPMCNTRSTSNITNTTDNTSMLNIISLLV
ncbi:C5 protein [Tomato leaf curl Uganda virus - [Iganga]]|uniref:C5 protein n=1 Tax=Tomato leaf curl Uganda virus - [Iganga] TaxID=341035 RepID=Q2FA51_9GEMI|nr:C5 protein [Tomato leaf curl Uganda virus - [Iganga]]AAZ77646.1 C5 protein [Tomato leaf curl Uganda virus - [Iganga]]